MFIDSISWKESWETLCDLNGGGQATAKKVKHKDSGIVAFLKILNKQDNLERRVRFFREATAYDSCNHPNIPSLIESNSQFHSDLNYKLYIAMEFVDGQTLTHLIEKEGSLAPSLAASITLDLINTIEYCHSQGWVHRDIKPDNIMLDDHNNPILLDFGLAYKEDVTPDFSTEPGQEIGNKFLRLPELMMYSPVKQDLRSDLSLIGAIYFYLLTGEVPVSVRDEKGFMPHQRKDAVEKIKEKLPNSHTQVRAFFDKVFPEKISERFISAEDMKQELKKQVKQEDAPQEESIEQDLEVILSAIKTKANSDMAKHKQLYDQAMNRIKEIHAALSPKFSPVYDSLQSSYRNSSEGLGNTLGYSHVANSNEKFAPRFLIKIVGEELVVHADNIAIYRTPIDTPDYSSRFDIVIKELFIKGMRTLVEGSST